MMGGEWVRSCASFIDAFPPEARNESDENTGRLHFLNLDCSLIPIGRISLLVPYFSRYMGLR
jgi:hypothetical protein